MTSPAPARDVSGGSPAISVIVLAHGPEPVLEQSLDVLLADEAGDVEVILVDNESPAVAGIAPHPRLRILRPPRNLGFAGGCDYGAEQARGGVLVFLNSDAIPEPGAVHALAETARERRVGAVCGSVRLAATPDLVNTVGNPVHFTGVVWVGGYGERAEQHAVRTDVAAVTGAFFAVRREVWDELGGMPTEYFAYHEDCEFSLRAWQHGYRVVFEPAAVARHHYVHDRSPLKHFLVQRNRLLTVLTVFPGPVLAAVLPAVVLYDLGQAIAATTHHGVRAGLGAKLIVWASVLKRVRWVLARRREIQRANVLPAADFADLLTARMNPRMIATSPAQRPLNVWFRGYWALARRALGAGSRAGVEVGT